MGLPLIDSTNHSFLGRIYSLQFDITTLDRLKVRTKFMDIHKIILTTPVQLNNSKIQYIITVHNYVKVSNLTNCQPFNVIISNLQCKFQ